MLKQVAKTTVVLVTSAVAIPYAVAILANLLYGWPQGKKKYRRAFHPWKVYSLNYAVLRELGNLKYLRLLMRWKVFYSCAEPDRVVKDVPYGSHGNTLDVYFPHDNSGHGIPGVKPVLLFIHGGTWGSGDKTMYGLLCSQLADKTGAIVCAVGYSVYPKGYVDDMVQDIVDALVWTQQNIYLYGGDRDRIGLVGHSAGAHLSVMAALELTLRRLIHHPEAAVLSPAELAGLAVSRQSSVFSESIRFEDRHFNGDAQPSSVSTTGSFIMVEGRAEGEEEEGAGRKEGSEGEGEAERSNNDSYFVLGAEEVKDAGEDGGESGDDVTAVGREVTPETGVCGNEARDSGILTLTETGDSPDGATGLHVAGGVLQPPDISIGDDSEFDLSSTQRELKDLLSSLKLIIGLAGVYHIGDHYEYESWRGVEDISTMCKAMDGEEHFDRFSPTHIVNSLPDNVRLPAVVLVHGDADTTVPISSSNRLAQAIWDRGWPAVHMAVIPGCGHADLCVDLMDPGRTWHGPVMGEVLKATTQYL